jgi:hypothetical protein
MKRKLSANGKPLVRRWVVSAVFDQGGETYLRDFHLWIDAVACKKRLKNRELFTTRKYSLEIKEVEMERDYA